MSTQNIIPQDAAVEHMHDNGNMAPSPTKVAVIDSLGADVQRVMERVSLAQRKADSELKAANEANAALRAELAQARANAARLEAEKRAAESAKHAAEARAHAAEAQKALVPVADRVFYQGASAALAQPQQHGAKDSASMFAQQILEKIVETQQMIETQKTLKTPSFRLIKADAADDNGDDESSSEDESEDIRPSPPPAHMRYPGYGGKGPRHASGAKTPRFAQHGAKAPLLHGAKGCMQQLRTALNGPAAPETPGQLGKRKQAAAAAAEDIVVVADELQFDAAAEYAADLHADKRQRSAASASSSASAPASASASMVRVGRFVLPASVRVEPKLQRRKPSRCVGVALIAASTGEATIGADDKRALRALGVWPKTASVAPRRPDNTMFVVVADDSSVLDVLENKALCENIVKLRLPIVFVSEAAQMATRGAFASADALRMALRRCNRRLQHTNGAFSLPRHAHELADLRAALVRTPLRSNWRLDDFAAAGDERSDQVRGSAFATLVTLSDIGLVHETNDDCVPAGVARRHDVLDSAATPAAFESVLARWFNF